MKKIVSFILIFSLSLTMCLSAFALDDTTISLDSMQTNMGETVTLTLSLKNNPGIAGLTVSLKYDTEVLTLIDVQNGSLFSEIEVGKNYLWENDKNIIADGSLATFTFEVSENAPVGTYIVEVISRKCANEDLEDVNLTTGNGKIIVKLPACDHSFVDNVCEKCDTVLAVSQNGKFESADTNITGDIKVPLSSNGVGVSVIGFGAFKNCLSLSSVMLFDNVTEIADDAFEGVAEDFVIKCYEDSPASKWAKEHNVNYEIVPIPYGNVDGNNKIDIFDLIDFAKYTVDGTVIDMRAANTVAPNKSDRAVDIFDLIALAQHVVDDSVVLGPTA